MLFNPDSKKQAVEILFSKRQHVKDKYRPLNLNGDKYKQLLVKSI